MPTEIRDFAALPRVPAVYLMLGGSPRFAAYVGIGGDLRERLSQHLVKRDSSVVTGTTAVGLNPDHVREVDWWDQDPAFRGLIGHGWLGRHVLAARERGLAPVPNF